MAAKSKSTDDESDNEKSSEIEHTIDSDSKDEIVAVDCGSADVNNQSPITTDDGSNSSQSENSPSSPVEVHFAEGTFPPAPPHKPKKKSNLKAPKKRMDEVPIVEVVPEESIEEKLARKEKEKEAKQAAIEAAKILEAKKLAKKEKELAAKKEAAEVAKVIEAEKAAKKEKERIAKKGSSSYLSVLCSSQPCQTLVA